MSAKKKKKKWKTPQKNTILGDKKNRLLSTLGVLVGLLHTEYLWNHLHKCITWCNVAIAFNTSMHSDPHSNTHTHTHTHTHRAEDIMTALVNKPKPITTEYINHSSVLFHYVKSSHSEGTVQSQVDLWQNFHNKFAGL